MGKVEKMKIEGLYLIFVKWPKHGKQRIVPSKPEKGLIS